MKGVISTLRWRPERMHRMHYREKKRWTFGRQRQLLSKTV